MQIAKRAYALAQEHHDSAVMIGACRVLEREQKSVSLEKRAEAKLPTGNIGDKKRVRQEGAISDYRFGNFLKGFA